MDVHIDELRSTVDTVDGDALLTPQTLDRIVRSVLRALANEQRARDSLSEEIDMRSVVEQQRGGER
jgi:hypothetical protein